MAIARAWIEVVTRPRRFFRAAVAPGDQAPGLTFAMAVVLVEEGVRIALVEGAYPAVSSSTLLSTTLWLAVAVLLVTPLALHFTAAIQTLALAAVVRDRAGIGETVQVVAYACAPCALAGIPDPRIRLVLGVYGTALLFVGLSIVHRTSIARATIAGAIPALLVFGAGFRALDSLESVLGQPLPW